ncbi:MAG: aminopeptidase P family N-terminal domain-containing protein, partial [SAR324 cluster bacterium]|nr:aminopeptidase P family N-terminal domain-containing protein [SAR324 cluster bacterium]
MSKQNKLLELPNLANVDLLVAMSPENFAYVSESYILTVELVRPRHAYAILIKDDDPILLVCSIEKYHAQEESWINDQR